jgi:DNA-binding NtrC family response regulator
MTHMNTQQHHTTSSWAVLVPMGGGASTLARSTDRTVIDGLPTPRWRVIPVTDRLVLGTDAVPGRLEGRGVAPRHCGLSVTPAGLKVIDLCGSTVAADDSLLQGPCVLSEGGLVRLGRVPVIAVRTREEGRKRWVGIGPLGSWSPSMLPVLAELALVAASTAPVLIGGETGTGKELAARALHQASARRDRPWVAVNCGALHGELLVAELFGADKGAYTGSTDKRKGAFERADGGTLLLDEIGELPLPAQAALLRVLESGEIQVLGGATRRVDVRVVCATHRDLHQAVAEGRFRLDLLHRIEVASLALPPLRARPEDVAGLTRQWWPDAADDADIVDALVAYRWPGNVRELRNCLQRLRLIAPQGMPEVAMLRHLLATRLPAPTAAVTSKAMDHVPAVARLLQAGLTTTDAQRASGMPRSTFYRHLKALRSSAA